MGERLLLDPWRRPAWRAIIPENRTCMLLVETSMEREQMERFGRKNMGMGKQKERAKLSVTDVKAAFPHPSLHSEVNGCVKK